jgi:long-chain acyl-CoA synthetase
MASTRNISEMLARQAERLGPRTALRYKAWGIYHDMSWQAYQEAVEAAACGLVARGVQAGDAVALLSENRLEWLVADLAILAIGGVTVPLHAALPPSQIAYQLAHAEAVCAIASTPAQFEKIASVRGSLPKMREVLCFEARGERSWERLTHSGVDESRRAEVARRRAAVGPADLATLIYTSGTTGHPKGVMLTHENLLSNASAFARMAEMPPDAVSLNWLPLSHIYARTVDHYCHLAAGTTLALAESGETVVANLREIQPTNLSSVPRLYEKVLSLVQGHSDWKERLRDIFGPRVAWLGCGGAPLPPSVAQAYREAGLLVLQGYGQTESSPVITFNYPARYRIETVGSALPDVEVRIAEDGEVLTRGPHVMKGYWRQPEATAEAIRDGWLHTGDLGRLDADGFLTITGRKKDLLVLSSGKKVVPSWVEGLLAGDPLIGQAVVYGEGRSFLTALIVPKWDKVHSELGPMAAPAAVEELLTKRVSVALSGVAPWEQVKRIVLVREPFSLAREEMTVSLKLRRNVILERYREQLEALYRES